MKWPWSREPSNVTLSIADPILAGYFTPGGLTNLAGVSVGEGSTLALSGFYRAAALISGTLGALTLRSLRETGDGMRERVNSIFDNPDGDDGQTAYEWKESLLLHLLLHGNAFALKLTNEAGGLARLPLVHPLSVSIDTPTIDEHRRGALPVGGKWFTLTLDNGERARYDARDIWHVPGLSIDGVRGISLISAARQSLGTAIAGDQAAAKMFSTGALISGLVTPEDDLTQEETAQIKQDLNRNVAGYENAGAIAVVNRRLKFSPWTMSAVDAQFLQSRQFQIEEIARWTGVPPHLLMQTEKQTSWGTGVEEQNRAMARTVLGPWAARVEQRASRLLPRPRFVEFDFASLERPSPDREIELLISQVQAGLLTVNEARAIRNLPPLPEPEPAPAPAPADDEEADDDPAAE